MTEEGNPALGGGDIVVSEVMALKYALAVIFHSWLEGHHDREAALHEVDRAIGQLAAQEDIPGLPPKIEAAVRQQIADSGSHFVNVVRRLRKWSGPKQ